MSSVHTTSLFACALPLCVCVCSACVCVCFYAKPSARHRYSQTHIYTFQSTLRHINKHIPWTTPQSLCHLRSRRWYLTWLSLESWLAGIMSLSGLLWMYQGQKQPTAPATFPTRTSQQQAQCWWTAELLFFQNWLSFANSFGQMKACPLGLHAIW